MNDLWRKIKTTLGLVPDDAGYAPEEQPSSDNGEAGAGLAVVPRRKALVPDALQREILACSDPLVVVDGCAGSGKSTLLVGLIARLVRRGVPPDQILAVTEPGQVEELADLCPGVRVEAHGLRECPAGVSYVLVDESQDAPGEDAEFYSSLWLAQLFVFGDLVRGEAESLLAVLLAEPSATVYRLDRNYRSVEAITTAATQLMRRGRTEPETEADAVWPRQMVSTVAQAWETPMEAWKVRWGGQVLGGTAQLVQAWQRAAPTERVAVICREQDQCDQIAKEFAQRQIAGCAVLTVEQCKGRSFDHVLIPFFSDDVWPGSNEPFGGLDAEAQARRELYLALTRARQTVQFVYQQTSLDELCAAARISNDKLNTLVWNESRFLAELNQPGRVVQRRQG